MKSPGRFKAQPQLILLLTIFTLPTAYPRTCPPDAIASAGAHVSVAAFRQDGTPIGSSSVEVGQQITVRVAVAYFPTDPITLGTLVSFQGGQMTLTLAETNADVTPIGGVPLLGTFDCDGLSSIWSQPLHYVVTEADAAAGGIAVRAEYKDGEVHLGDLPATVRGVAHTWIRVGPFGTSMEACPSNALVAAQPPVTITALRLNGTPVGSGSVGICEKLRIRMGIVVPFDPITGGSIAAIEGGRFSITVNALTRDVTPATGIPLLGGDATPSCNGLFYVASSGLEYTVTAADAAAGYIRIRGDYTGGVARFTGQPTVDGSGHTLVRVRPADQVLACPCDATAAEPLVSVTAYRQDGTPISDGFVESCETIAVRMQVAYSPQSRNGEALAAFEGGTFTITVNGITLDVTPPSGIPMLGTPECGGILSVVSRNFFYTVTPADAAAGSIAVSAEYLGGIARLSDHSAVGGAAGTSIAVVSMREQMQAQTNHVALGGSKTLTIMCGTDATTETIEWSGPNDFSSTNRTIAIENAQPEDEGLYIATIRSATGCARTCRAWLAVSGHGPLHITRSGSENVLLHFQGLAGRSYHIEASEDLLQWTNLGPAVPTSPGAYRFRASKPAGSLLRFYRYISQ